MLRDTETYSDEATTAVGNGDWPSVGTSSFPPFPSQRPTVRSAAAKRAEDTEESLAVVILDSTFSSRSTDELHARLSENVWRTSQFGKLPLHRRRFLEGFQAGVREAAARFLGEPSQLHAAVQARVPDRIRVLQPGARWSRHPNGNGWVAHTAYVEPSVYVGPEALVYEYARCTERSVVKGQGRVCGRAEMTGHATVRSQAVLGGNARLGGRTVLAGNLKATGTLRAPANATLTTDRDVDRHTLRRATMIPPPLE